MAQGTFFSITLELDLISLVPFSFRGHSEQHHDVSVFVSTGCQSE